MIQRITRKQLDVAKYNACVENSIQSRVYAYSWYLDSVCDSWEVLVLNDYKAVMPIPFLRLKRNLYFKKIIQPLFCQQLGVFSFEENTDLENTFLEELIKLSPVKYNFNSNNFYKKDKITNYEIDLTDTYSNIRSHYSKSRRYRVNQAYKNELEIIEENNPNGLVQIAKENYNISAYKNPVFNRLKKTINISLENKRGRLVAIKQNSKLLGGAFFLIDNNRVIYLFSAFTEEGKKNQVPSFLIDQMLKQYSETDKLIFDFEGSIIPNIASFFRSFGAIDKGYFQYAI